MQITCPVDGIYIFFIYIFLIKQTCIHIFLFIKLIYLIKHFSNFLYAWLIEYIFL